MATLFIYFLEKYIYIFKTPIGFMIILCHVKLSDVFAKRLKAWAYMIHQILLWLFSIYQVLLSFCLLYA